MKKVVSLVLTLMLLLSLAACGETQPTPSTQPDAGVYPMTVTDQAGREVVLEQEPQRLVSCYYITTSLLLALDLEERTVGVEDHPEYRPLYGYSAPAVLELPWVGTAKTLDVESVAALNPDLVILPMRQKESASVLEELGFDVLLVNPESQALLTEMIRLVGKATNTTEKAEALIQFTQTQKDDLQKALSGTETPSVYLAGNSSMLSTAGDAMYQSDMIRLAGGTNVAADITDTYWAEIDYEQLLTWDPAYIILASNASYTVEDVLQDPNLASCTAVKNKNVYRIPSDAEAWDSPVPGSILGATWLANVLHPEQITDEQCRTVMDTYYETFYHFTYSSISE